jgi:hypothetical protein
MIKEIKRLDYKDFTWYFIEDEDGESVYKYNTLAEAIGLCTEMGWDYDVI